MKKIFSYLLICFFSLLQAQEYIVTAPNGLLARDKPNGKKIGKIPYGTKISVTKKIEPYSVIDEGRNVSGYWVESKINHSNFENYSDFDPSKLIVFSGFLSPVKDFINEQEKTLNKYTALQDFYLSISDNVFAIKGDFFGDGVKDNLYKMIDKNGNKRLIILDNKTNNEVKIYSLGGKKDPFNIIDYSFGTLYTVSKGTPLWSNYEDDFIEFKDVPKHKITYLNYDAIYVHLEESCGGGYIFWKNNKWNWLQQE